MSRQTGQSSSIFSGVTWVRFGSGEGSIAGCGTSATNNPLFFDNNTLGVALNASDLEFHYEPGVRISFVRHSDCGLDWELSYTGIDSWNQQIMFDSGVPFSFTENFNGFPFTDIQAYEARYSSDFFTWEINARNRVSDEVTWFAGFRMVELNEDILIRGETAGLVFIDLTSTSTDNRMYGFQVGADAALACVGQFRIDAVAKAGLYYNAARQRSVDVNGTLFFPGANVTAEKDDSAFLAELGVTARYDLSECVALRFGYNAVWLRDVALAPDQTDNTDIGFGFARLDNHGDVFAHGFVAGLEWVR